MAGEVHAKRRNGSGGALKPAGQWLCAASSVACAERSLVGRPPPKLADVLAEGRDIWISALEI